MELIADTSNGGKLIEMMRGQADTPELITPSDLEVIAFIAQNHEIMELAERMAGNLQASKDLEKMFRVNREQIINDLIDYYLQHLKADDFFSSHYKEFIEGKNV